jgi:hypothetical protein
MDDFKTMAEQLIENRERYALAYCDYIAMLICVELLRADRENQGFLESMSSPKSDLDENGVLMSTMKIIHVTDRQGKDYTITVEERP